MQPENDDDLDGGQRSSEVKWGKLCAMAATFGQKKPWCKLRMMMTLMEVKGHQRSNGVNYVLWLPYLVKRSADANWEWWWPLWRSKVISMAGKNVRFPRNMIKFPTKIAIFPNISYVFLWFKLLHFPPDDKISWEPGSPVPYFFQPWSSEVKCGKLCDMATIFGQKNHWCKLGMMMTFMEVKANRGQIHWIIFVTSMIFGE